MKSEELPFRQPFNGNRHSRFRVLSRVPACVPRFNIKGRNSKFWVSYCDHNIQWGAGGNKKPGITTSSAFVMLEK
jgi:hypothetical protein